MSDWMDGYEQGREQGKGESVAENERLQRENDNLRAEYDLLLGALNDLAFEKAAEIKRLETDARNDHARRAMNEIGASGRYLQGKLDESDEGELTMAISRDGNIIYIDFGKSLEWIAMSPEEAIGLAQLLLERAGDER